MSEASSAAVRALDPQALARAPKHADLDAERSLLGGVLNFGAESMAEVAQLGAPDFFHEGHGVVFEALLALHEDSAHIDRVSVKDHLRARGVLESIGGEGFIDLLEVVTPVSTNLAYYAGIIRKHAAVRGALKQLRGAWEASDPGGIEAALERASAVLRGPVVDTSATASLLGFRTLDEILDEELPPIEWLWEPYIEAGSLCGMVAPPNIGKTLLAFFAATEAAQRGQQVRIIEMEGGRRGFKKRLSRAVMAAGGRDKCRTIRSSFKPRLSLLNPADVDKVSAECVGAKLIIIDSLACVTPGLEENDVAAMGQVVRSLQIIQQATGAAVLILHHTMKTKWKPGEAPSIGDGRGSGALDAALDAALALAPIPEADQVSGFVSFSLYNTKQRDEEKAPPRLVRIAMAGIEANVELLDPHLQKFVVDDYTRNEVLKAIPESEASARSKNAVFKICGGNRPEVFKTISAMIEEGTIQVSNGRLYRGRQEDLSGI